MYLYFLSTVYQFSFRHLDVLDLCMRIFFIALYVCVSFAFYCILAIVIAILCHVDSTGKRKKRIYEQNKL